MEVPRFNFQRIDVQIPDVDFPRLWDRLWPIPRTPSSRAAVGELVTAVGRKLEVEVAVGQL